MISRRLLIHAAIAGIGTMAILPAQAFQARPFDAKAFEAAQAAGKPILVEISAPWCPTCKAQKPILSELATKPKFKELVAFEIDFDSQKELLRKFGVNMQSTLITFKGSKEMGRSTGDTNAASIESLIDKSI
ncbi:MAG: thioredoxin domain-containing protein [bacterium]|nr:thioredoxin domain-containing protein [bacterium]